jgi:hypothetical protein
VNARFKHNCCKAFKVWRGRSVRLVESLFDTLISTCDNRRLGGFGMKRRLPLLLLLLLLRRYNSVHACAYASASAVPDWLPGQSPLPSATHCYIFLIYYSLLLPPVRYSTQSLTRNGGPKSGSPPALSAPAIEQWALLWRT